MLLDFGTTVLFMTIGYLIGSISWAIIISKLIMKEDVRTKGSGNAGATNALRNYGKKVGLFVFTLDVLKPIIAIVFAFTIKNYTNNNWNGILLPAVGLAALVGHVFPIFFKFKGGKGAACLLGLFISAQWILAIIGFIVFVIIVAKTKYVSLGSMLASFLLVMMQIIFVFVPHMNEAWSIPMFNNYWWITTLFLFASWLIVAYKHKENIKRLINKTERKIG